MVDSARALFDVIPDDRAIAHRSVFWLQQVPIFYSPFFYKSLRRTAPRAAFSPPTSATARAAGKMIGVGYYWAINRSYDATTARVQYFTQSGLAHTVDFRGKPTERTDFNAYLYGVSSGVKVGNTIQKEGGMVLSRRGPLGPGRRLRAGRGELLELIRFPAGLPETFSGPSPPRSTHRLRLRQWSTYSLDFVLQRLEKLRTHRARDRS